MDFGFVDPLTLTKVANAEVWKDLAEPLPPVIINILFFAR